MKEKKAFALKKLVTVAAPGFSLTLSETDFLKVYWPN